MRSALCSCDISSGNAVSGVYTRPEKYGNLAGSPWMCVWQSQAPAGTSKFTGVAGCEALARLGRARMTAPATIAPTRTSRRVSMVPPRGLRGAMISYPGPPGERRVFASARRLNIGIGLDLDVGREENTRVQSDGRNLYIGWDH